MESSDVDALCINVVDHPTASIRIAALSLLISSFKTTAPLSSSVLLFLRKCIPNLHQETDSKTRHEFIALIKRLCTRLSSAAKDYLRLVATPNISGGDFVRPDECLIDHVQMIQWYQHYLWHELRPTASYPSHTTALKVVPLFFGDSILSQVFFSDAQYIANRDQLDGLLSRKPVLSLLRPLLDLHTDPFDDVRLSASEALCLLYPFVIRTRSTNGDNKSGEYGVSGYDAQTELVHQIESALPQAVEKVRKSGRADHADGLGRLYKFYFGLKRIDSCATIIKDRTPFNNLLCALEQSLQVKGQDAPSSLLSFPLHGYLISLR